MAIRRTTISDLIALLKELGVDYGDSLLVHSSIISLGLVEEGCAGILQAIQQVIGPGGTLLVPTFTWSFRRGEVFDIRHSPCPKSIGAFSEYVRKHPDAIRSGDPLFSMSAIGPQAEYFVERRSHNCFGPESSYERIVSENAKILAMGITYSTGISIFMHAERLAEVAYRKELQCNGESIGLDGVAFKDWAIHYARNELEFPGSYTNRENVGRELEAMGVIQAQSFGTGRHVCFEAQPFVEAVVNKLAENPKCMLVESRTL